MTKYIIHFLKPRKYSRPIELINIFEQVHVEIRNDKVRKMSYVCHNQLQCLTTYDPIKLPPRRNNLPPNGIY